MPNLIVCRDSKDYKVFLFSDVIKIGRDESNDVFLDSSEISRFHASIDVETGGRCILSDNGSTNGTWVGNEKIESRPLSHGATFRIVHYLFTFLDDAAVESVEQKVLPGQGSSLEEEYHPLDDTVLTIDRNTYAESRPYHGSENRLSSMLASVREIVAISDYQTLIQRALDTLLKTVGAKRGFLVLKNDDNELVYQETSGFGKADGKLKVNRNIITRVMEEGCAISSANSLKEGGQKDPRHSDQHAVICAPLITREEVLGCIYLDTPRHSGAFTPDDREILKIGAQEIAVAIENAGLHKKVQDKRTSLKSQLSMIEDIVIESDVMVTLYQDILVVAEINACVLVFGESGTGKDLMVRALHGFSKRSGELIALNCSAIPRDIFEGELFGSVKGAFTGATDKPGKLEQADGGTIFLDEIGDMALSLQPKLLRFLENKEVTRLGDARTRKVDVRVVAATNQDLNNMIKEKRFREDLYHRLNEIELKIPPLRERRDDIKPLFKHFLLKFSDENNWNSPNVSDKAKKMLEEYNWPGNVRELEHVAKRVSLRVLGKTIYPEDLLEASEELKNRSGAPDERHFVPLEEMEKNHIRVALDRAGWNITVASKLLGISRSTLYEKVRKYKLTSQKGFSAIRITDIS